MFQRFFEIVSEHAVELGIIGALGFVLLLILAYAIVKGSDATARAVREDEEDRFR